MQEYTQKFTSEERKRRADIAANLILRKVEQLGLTATATKSEIAKRIELAVDGAEFCEFYAKSDDPSWSCEASVQVALHPHPTGNLGICAEAQINWSSSYRCVSMALNAVNNYRKAIDFAAFIEAYLR